MSMKGIAILANKGGVGKTSLCHLLALGSVLKGVPAHVMHTDDRPPIQTKGRSYMYYDARNPEILNKFMEMSAGNDGLFIVDGGGNRPEFDKLITDAMDLVIIPVTPDPEAVTMAIDHMKRLEGYGGTVRFVMNIVSANQNSRIYDFREYFSKLDSSKVIGEVRKVEAVKRLRMSDDTSAFPTPPTPVNNLARSVFRQVNEALDRLNMTEEKTEEAHA
jgi:cellulose biosynthesis protein BcsQ